MHPTRGGWKAALAASVLLGSPAWAQSYPAKPIRFIVGFAPGGPNDILARIVGQKLSENTSVPVPVDNRPGADSIIGTQLAARAPADGYTIAMISASSTIHPSVYTNIPFDIAKDLAPVGLLASGAFVLVVNPSVPARSVKDLVALARAKPGQLNFASSGVGGTLHLSGELFKVMAGVDMVHVPFKGAGPAALDVLAGRGHLTFDSIPVWIGHIKAGRVRALGVTTLERSATLPDLPTVAESGLPGFDVANWLAVYAPAKTPRPVIDRINATLATVMADADIRRQLLEQGVESAHTTPAELAALMRRDTEKWARIVKASGAKLD